MLNPETQTDLKDVKTIETTNPTATTSVIEATSTTTTTSPEPPPTSNVENIIETKPTTTTSTIIPTTSNDNNQQPLTNKHQQQFNNNLLNEHDYCSPNKMKSSTQNHHHNQPPGHKLNVKTPGKYNNNETTNNNYNNKSIDQSTSNHHLNDNNQRPHSTSFESFSHKITDPTSGDLSDSSLSSSSSSVKSSVTSNSNLVIAQEHIKQAMPLVPANTPSVKRKPGRPPLAKKEFLSKDGSSQDTTTKIKRERQPRQSTSVTDKSQWITGEDELESALSEHLSDRKPRERRINSGVKEPDPAFSQYTSSDYSSSDAESDDQDSDDNSEDDPNRLWCICRKPHDNKFMICCDICKDWFHGHCVGVTKLMGDRFEKQGKEWFCGECQEKLRSGIPRSAIPNNLVKKEKKTKSSTGKRGRGRPRKSESMREAPTRSLRSSRKSSSSLDPKLGVDNTRLRKNLARNDVRSESFDEFQDSQKLKELIRERKKAFFYKRQLAAQQKAARRGEVIGIGTKQPITANLSDRLDSLATSTSTPNMNNLPINIKEKLKPNIVLQINMKKDPSSDANSSTSRIVTTIVRSPKKKISTNNPIVNDLFSADPIQVNKKIIVKPMPSLPPKESTSSDFHASSGGDNNTQNSDNIRKRSDSSNSKIKREKHKQDVDQEPSSTKKKRKDSESSLTNGSNSASGSQHFVMKIKEILETRCNQFTDLSISNEKIEIIATNIESKLNEFFKEGTPKYRNKFASIVFNLKDPKNQALAKNVLTEEIEPARLVNMSPDELASNELAKWRERENKHSLELIKRDAELAAQQVIVKKTHKGEEVINAPSVNEPDDPTAAKDHQETPITPNKLSKEKDAPPRVDGSKITLTPPVIKPPTIKPIEYNLDEMEVEDEHPLDRDADTSSPHLDLPPSSSFVPFECWSGTLITPDVGKLTVTAKSLSGTLDIEKGDIEENIMVCGRIAHDQVQSYVKKIKSTTNNPMAMIQIFPSNDESKEKFGSLCTGLYTKNRYGVIQTNPRLKDFYIIPIVNNGNIPEVLKSCIRGSSLDRTEPNCLVGLLIKMKKMPSNPLTLAEPPVFYTPNSASYTSK